MNETVSAVAELASSLKGVARWFVVITVMAAIALWTLAIPTADAARDWLPFALQTSIVCAWAGSAFCFLPVVAGISGVAAFLAPHVDLAGFIPKAIRQRPQIAIADTPFEVDDIGGKESTAQPPGTAGLDDSDADRQAPADRS